MKGWLKYLGVVCLALVFAGCQKANDPDPTTAGFDRSALLTFYADQVIIPGYDSLWVELSLLKAKSQAFAERPDSTGLSELRHLWLNAYFKWLQVAPFNFGPAGEAGVRKTLFEELAVFPVSATKIEAILNSGTYNLTDFNRDARGLGAIEYLLYHAGSYSSVLEKFNSNNAALVYLQALCQHAEAQVNTMSQTWKSSYRAEFISSTGADAGSSTSILYNEFVKSYEALRNYKLGLPMGNRPGQIGPEPNLAESYYAQKSVAFIRAHFETLAAVWEGRSPVNGNKGPGFKSYLEKVEGGPALVVSTQDQIVQCTEALKAIPEDQTYTQLLTGRHPALEAAYTQLQKQTRFFKSDMSSLLGIAITYSSGDGD